VLESNMLRIKVRDVVIELDLNALLRWVTVWFWLMHQ
jgi:hypothetical protein